MLQSAVMVDGILLPNSAKMETRRAWMDARQRADAKSECLTAWVAVWLHPVVTVCMTPLQNNVMADSGAL